MKRKNDISALILRLSLGGLMLPHGISKLQHGLGYVFGTLTEIGLPAFLAYGVYIGEVLAPIAMIIGFRTRLASLVFVGNCIAAMYLGHRQEFFNLNAAGNGWVLELLGLFLFGALALVFSGGGKYAFSTKNKFD